MKNRLESAAGRTRPKGDSVGLQLMSTLQPTLFKFE